ncbi:flagellar FlbD family protein [Abyssisolibacter fermentans]|uniref:flagellar FlbD family protein n=1 Tax=Abyssisolibacter fermentans TaxID=1766203 RepID=UPI00083161BC|nr:flagellar FlbD family protein [Abyssisolibacter fermentans]
MILVKRMNDTEFIINSDLIETVEETPDTVITLVNGKKMVVKDSKEEIVEKVIKFKRKYTIGCIKADLSEV